MAFSTVRALSCIAAALALLTAFASPAQAQEAVIAKDYDLFVDPPTAFAFIKLPTGWKFVGKLDAEQLRHLPAGTLTSLLPQDNDSTLLLAAKSRPSAARAKT